MRILFQVKRLTKLAVPQARNGCNPPRLDPSHKGKEGVILWAWAMDRAEVESAESVFAIFAGLSWVSAAPLTGSPLVGPVRERLDLFDPLGPPKKSPPMSI